MTSERVDILGSVRGRLGVGDRSVSHRPSARVKEHELGPAHLRQFEAQLERASATWARVADVSCVGAAVGAYMEEAGLPAQTVVAAGLGDAEQWDCGILDLSEVDFDLDGVAIVTECQYGIAETGTLVSLSGASMDVRLNFLAETHIVVLKENRVVMRPEDVWAALRNQGPPSFMPWAVHFITGPSRTADIEQTVELGAHGPRSLHVILVAG